MTKSIHNILDAVALDVLPLRYMCLAEGDYCLATNRHWHGFDLQELADVIASLLSMGVLRRFGPNSSGVGLTPAGGRLWRTCYNVNLDAYIEVGGYRSERTWSLHSLGRGSLEVVAAALSAKFPSMADKLEIEPIPKWTPTYWRRRSRAYRLELPLIEGQSEDEVLGVVWRASPPWRIDPPKELHPFCLIKDTF